MSAKPVFVAESPSPVTDREGAPVRIFLHDYGNYPFTFELARYWAGRGHPVHLAYCGDFDESRASDRARHRPGIHVTGIQTNGNKYKFLSKPSADREYGKRIGRLIASLGCDVVISGNTPLDGQFEIANAASRSGAAFVYWMHDYISQGIRVAVGRRFFQPLGVAAAACYRGLEHRLLRSSSAVVLASPQFRPVAARAGVSDRSCFVIENWCPLDDVTPLPRDNAWAREHDLCGRPVLLYSGMLGLKHDPSCLLTLARRLTTAKVVVVAHGPGADWLRGRGALADVRNLLVLPFQPYSRLSEVLASATMLIAISDQAAASFCYPSKILTYLAAGRAILGLMPRDGFAASLILSTDSGVVLPPAELARSTGCIAKLLDDPVALTRMSQAARKAALSRCDIGRIGPAFNRVLAACLH